MLKGSNWKKSLVIFGVFSVLAVLVWVAESAGMEFDGVVVRNDYGDGKKTEEYRLTIEGEIENETFQLEVEEQEYTPDEVQKVFQEIFEKLDEIVLGENESFDHVEKDLNLVTELSGYPMTIQWEISSYGVMNIEGEIQAEDLPKEGTLLEIRGNITYGTETAVYVRNVMVYPVTREGKDKLIYEIRQALTNAEAQTRQEESFTLPAEVSGKKLKWSQEKAGSWFYVLILGGVLSVYVIYKERDQIKKAKKLRNESLLREYPGMISKITMLLSTGTTVKNAWDKIVQNYEKQKSEMGSSFLYEEMKNTYHEMQAGIPEAEAYERFGKRCALTVYVKFGALLSQNLRKGSKGISEILRMEAIQSFENRKGTAKRKGEEAGAKLLMPMMGMLAVVLIMVMVPAFMTMQL